MFLSLCIKIIIIHLFPILMEISYQIMREKLNEISVEKYQATHIYLLIQLVNKIQEDKYLTI